MQKKYSVKAKWIVGIVAVVVVGTAVVFGSSQLQKGAMMGFSSVRGQPRTQERILPRQTKNIAPGQPTNLKATATSLMGFYPGRVFLSWEAGVDDGIPQNYPTFRLYVKDAQTGKIVFERPWWGKDGSFGSIVNHCPKHIKNDLYDWPCTSMVLFGEDAEGGIVYKHTYKWAVEQGDGAAGSGYSDESEFKVADENGEFKHKY